MKSKISLVLVLCMLISVLNGVTFIASAAGTGVEGDPIIITTQADLEAIDDSADDLAKHYKLGNNIYLSQDYTSIGSSTAPFTGVFDGNGKAIWLSGTANGVFAYSSGIVKNIVTYGSLGTANSSTYIGAVVGVNKGTITNCVNDAKVNGKNYVGGIAGQTIGGTISCCTNNNDITSVNWGQQVAGITGTAENSIISYCVNNGEVLNGGKYIGGIVGYQNKSNITNSYNTASVTGKQYVGGISGGNAGAVNINDCYNSGNITSTAGAEVAGVNGYSASGTDNVTNCYNIGAIKYGSTDYTTDNAIFGINAKTSGETVKLSNCYYLSAEAAAEKTNVTFTDCKNLTDAEMKVPTNFAGFGFEGEDAVWKMGTGEYLYPVLIIPASKINLNTDGFYIEIDSQEDFNSISSYSGCDFKVTADFTLTGHTPVATLNSVFDGNNKTITFVNASQGLFTEVGENAIVKNVKTSGKITSTSEKTAAIAGTNNGTITDCINGAEISSTAKHTAGIAGLNQGEISSCINNAAVSGGQNTGGITGYHNSAASLSLCGNNGAISSEANGVGGIAGYVYIYKGTTIEKCYNTGSIYSKGGNAGGIIGLIADANTVRNCFNAGSITCRWAYENIGGIVGKSNSGASSIEKCYNLGSIFQSLTTEIDNNAIFGENAKTDGTEAITLSNCYYYGTAMGDKENVTVTNCKNLSSDELKDSTNYSGFSFSGTDAVWTMGESSYPYPVLNGIAFSFAVINASVPAGYAFKDADGLDVSEIPGITDEEKNTLAGKNVLIAFAKVVSPNLIYDLSEYGFVILKDDGEATSDNISETINVTDENGHLNIGVIIHGNIEDNTDKYYIAPYAIYKDADNKLTTFYGNTLTCEPTMVTDTSVEE